MLTRESLLNLRGSRVAGIEVDGIDGPAFVRVLTLSELEVVTRRQESLPKGSLKASAVLVAATLCDASRNTLFDVNSDLDVEAIADLPFTVVKAISDAASRANGFGDDAVRAAEKN